MSSSLTFMMGKHPAVLPADVRYCKNHMWCRPTEGGVHRFGFSAYAVRLMQDVYFLEWKVDEGAAVAAKQEIGFIETSKATSELYSPAAGVLTRFNQDLLGDPSGINVDGYGTGWLFDLAGDVPDAMDAAAYHAFLATAWESAQRIIKGQINAAED